MTTVETAEESVQVCYCRTAEPQQVYDSLEIEVTCRRMLVVSISSTITSGGGSLTSLELKNDKNLKRNFEMIIFGLWLVHHKLWGLDKPYSTSVVAKSPIG